MSVPKIVREELKNLLSVFSREFISEQVEKHAGKIHAVSVESRVRGAIHQSLNIKFGNAIESMLSRIIDASSHLKLHEYSGKRVDLPVSAKKVKLIDDYVNSRPGSTKTVNADFGKLRKALKSDCTLAVGARIVMGKSRDGEVLVAKMQSVPTAASTLAVTSALTLGSSNTASTIRSQPDSAA